MGQAPSPPCCEIGENSAPLDERSKHNPGFEALVQENAHLRELVGQLSELIVKYIVDPVPSPPRRSYSRGRKR
jgi:hypothetical protein